LEVANGGDADLGDAVVNGLEGVLKFGDHAAADGAVVGESAEQGLGEMGNERGGVGGVAEHAGELEAEG